MKTMAKRNRGLNGLRIRNASKPSPGAFPHAGLMSLFLVAMILLSATSSFGERFYRGHPWCERPAISSSARGTSYKYDETDHSVTPDFYRSRDRFLQFLQQELPGFEKSRGLIYKSFQNAIGRHTGAPDKVYQDSPWISVTTSKIRAEGYARHWASRNNWECGEVLIIEVPSSRVCSRLKWQRIIVESGRPVLDESHPILKQCDVYETFNDAEYEWVFLHEIPSRSIVGSECFPSPGRPMSCSGGEQQERRYTEGRTKLKGKPAGSPSKGREATSSSAPKQRTVTIGGVTIDVTQLINTVIEYLKGKMKAAIQAKAEQLVSDFESKANQYSEEIYQDFLAWLNEQAHTAGISQAPITTMEFEREFLAWIDSPQAQIGSYVEKYLRERYSTVAWLIDTYRDEASWEIVNGLKGLWADADSKLKRFTQAREEIAANPRTPYSEILKKYGFSGPWIDNFRSYEGRFTTFNDKYRAAEAGSIIVGAFQSDVPREKVRALFSLIQLMGNVASRSQIPIVSFFGDIVQIYADVARAMLDQVNGLREALRKRQDYCLGEGTTDIDDERQRAFSKINRSGDLICPTDLSPDIYQRVVPNDGNIFFWTNGTFMEGRSNGGGISGVRESMALLKEVGMYRPGYAGKENDIATIARVYNVAYSHQAYGTGIGGLRREAGVTIDGIIKRLTDVSAWFNNLGTQFCSTEAVESVLQKEAGAASAKEIRMLLGMDTLPQGAADVASLLKTSYAIDFVDTKGGAYEAYRRMWDRLKLLSCLFVEGEVREEGKEGPCPACAGGSIQLTLTQGETLKGCQRLSTDASGKFYTTIVARSSNVVANFVGTVGRLKSQTERVDSKVLGLTQVPFLKSFGPLILSLSGAPGEPSKEKETIEIPKVVGLSLEKATEILERNSLTAKSRLIGNAPTQDMEKKVTAQNPAPSTKATSGSIVLLDYYGAFDVQAAVSKADCPKRWPGSVGVWNQAKSLVECVCPEGNAWNPQLGACTVSRKAALSITKKADRATVPAGEIVTYTYLVKNTGSLPLAGIAVTDDRCPHPHPVRGTDTTLNPGDVRQFECNMELVADTTNTAFARGRDPSQGEVKSTPVSATVKVTAPTAVKVPNVLRMPRPSAEQYIREAGLRVGTVTSRYDEDIPKDEVADQTPSPLTGKKVLVGSVVHLVISLGPQPKMRRLWVEPSRATRTVGQTASFRALVIWNTGKEDDITSTAVWTPGSLGAFTCRERGLFVIRSDFEGLSALATVTCEEDWSVPAFEPPMTSSANRDARVPPAGQGDYTWYAFCNPKTGEVTYGQQLPTGQKILAGPFPGPRTVYDWIAKNCSTWRCDANAACALTPAMGGEWKVLCGKNDLRVVLGKSYDLTKYMLIKDGFLGEPDARAWTQRAYPASMCLPDGRPAPVSPRNSGVTPRRGGRWAVVCDRHHGGVGLTQYPDPVRQWVMSESLLGEPDARAWTNQNCPSWRCDANGQCLKGVTVRTPEGEPLEAPPTDPNKDSLLGEHWRASDNHPLPRPSPPSSESRGTTVRTDTKPRVEPPGKRAGKEEWLSDAEAKALQKELWDRYNKRWCNEWCVHREERKKAAGKGGRLNWSGCAEEPLRALKVPCDMAWWARTRAKQGIVRNLAACYDPCVMRDISPQDRQRCYKDCHERNPMPK